jgi:imidazolonepropionase-like amidohydrolase
MKQSLPVLLALAAAAGVFGLLATAPSYAERPHVYALKEARIVVAPGKIIPKGNVIIRDGLIEAAGAGASIPGDAVEIDASGKTVYAGLIDAHTTIGLRRAAATQTTGGGRGAGQIAALLAAQQPREATPGANHPIARIHPEMNARDLIVPFEETAAAPASGGGGRGGAGAAAPAATAAAAGTDAERYRNVGFTTVLVEPDNGIIRGESAVIELRDSAPVTALMVKDHVAQHISIAAGGGFGGGGGYPGSLMGVITSVRQALLDTQRYQTWKQRYAANPAGMKRPEYSPSFEALGPVVAGQHMVIFDTEAAEDILAADRIAREFNLKAVMGADSNTYELLDRVKATGRTLILSASMPDRPQVDDPDDAFETDTRDLQRFVNAPVTAKRLADARIPFVLSSRGIRNPSDFPRNIRRIIEAGLPADTALAKLTTEPAELLGLSGQLGTVEAGKVANLIVTDGDLFGERTRVVRVFVDGYEYMGAPPPAAAPARGGPGGNRPPSGDPEPVNQPQGGAR